jgi:uncharacterized protein
MDDAKAGAHGGTAVRDNAALSRFELALPGALAVLDYRRAGRVLSLDHAGVPPQFEGQGVGSRLVGGSLALIRARGEQVLPRCSFVVAYMQRHPEFNDLRASTTK